MLDRIMHHAIVVQISGESYRLKDRHRAVVIGAPRLDQFAGVRLLLSRRGLVRQISDTADKKYL